MALRWAARAASMSGRPPTGPGTRRAHGPCADRVEVPVYLVAASCATTCGGSGKYMHIPFDPAGTDLADSKIVMSALKELMQGSGLPGEHRPETGGVFWRMAHRQRGGPRNERFHDHGALTLSAEYTSR
jgi:hypothetical protein